MQILGHRGQRRSHQGYGEYCERVALSHGKSLEKEKIRVDSLKEVAFKLGL